MGDEEYVNDVVEVRSRVQTVEVLVASPVEPEVSFLSAIYNHVTAVR